MITYKNKSGFPIIRACFNCKNYIDIAILERGGYCTLRKTLYAYSLEETCYFMVRHFYLCEQHEFKNEDFLKEVSEPVNLKDIIKKRDFKEK